MFGYAPSQTQMNGSDCGCSRFYWRNYGKGICNADRWADRIRQNKRKDEWTSWIHIGLHDKRKPVRVRCTVCGGEFERTYHNITTKGSVTCPYCVEADRIKRREAKAIEQERKKSECKRKRKEREAEAERNREARKHACSVCGTITHRRKYCSTECAKKADNKRRDFNRRMKLSIARVDTDITVEGLYRRDNGTCYLCGGRCNYEDYTVIDGNFIAGDWYPSIDHVIPLAKGGKHSWDNVMLAHRLCNSRKSDKL